MLSTFDPYLLIPAAVLLSVLVLLAVPVTISFSVVRREAFTGRITFGWLFGLLRITPSIPTGSGRKRRRRRPADTPSEPDDSPEEAQREASRTPAKRFLRVLKSRGFVRGVLRLLFDLAGCVRFVSLHVAGRVGLDDPCDTGRLWGNICAATGFLHSAKRVRFQVEPDFDGAVLELDGRGEIRIIPVTLFLPAVRFIFSPATLRAAWTASKRAG